MLTPHTNSIDSLADWAEWYVASRGESLSKAKLASMLASMPTTADEEDIDSALLELARREQLYGPARPFGLEGDIISPVIRWQDRPEYMMCLIFSIEGVRKAKGKNDGTKLFERLSREAALAYLNGRAEVIGFPNASALVKQIKDLATSTGERLGDRVPKPKDKDKGVDVVAWKGYGDKRDNQIVLLLQCGAGFHFDTKKPISVVAWREFIRWSACPVQGIMVPVVISIDDWLETRDDYNLIFDRVRIHLALHGREPSDPDLRAEIKTWCVSKLEQV